MIDTIKHKIKVIAIFITMETFNYLEKTLFNRLKNRFPQRTNIYNLNTNIFCNHRLGLFEMLIFFMLVTEDTAKHEYLFHGCS